MKEKIKVSIIIPAYNTGKSLNYCLNSLTKQTLKNIEIIVVDDGSKEDIKSIANKYESVIYIKNKHMGIGYTRNTGIKKATGEYIGFVDSDDYVSTDMYENYYNFAKENNLDIVVGNYIKIMNDKKTYIKVPFFEISNVKQNPLILTKIDYGPCNKIYRRDLIKKHKIIFDENMKYEDMLFVSKALSHSKRIGHIRKAYYYYIVRRKSETTTFDERNFDIIKILEIFSKIFKKNNFEETEYVVVSKLLDYNIQQRNNRNGEMRNGFINESFNYIYDHFPNYKKNKYLKKEKYFKKMIKQNKMLTKAYCSGYQTLRLYDKIK